MNGTSTNRKDVEGFNVRLGANGSSTLTVLARAVYNGSTIQCVTGSNGVVKESRIVTLMIQGSYHEPEDNIVNAIFSLVLLFLSVQSSLEGCGQEADTAQGEAKCCVLPRKKKVTHMFYCDFFVYRVPKNSLVFI